MDEAKIRAWWSYRQGLDGSLCGSKAGQVLERSGWARSVGGAGPYLTLYARAGIGREDADRAVAALEIHELPSARGCTYVVPSADFPLALKVGQEFGAGQMNDTRDRQSPRCSWLIRVGGSSNARNPQTDVDDCICDN